MLGDMGTAFQGMLYRMRAGSVQIGLESLFLEERGDTLQSLCCRDCPVSLLAGNKKPICITELQEEGSFVSRQEYIISDARLVRLQLYKLCK